MKNILLIMLLAGNFALAQKAKTKTEVKTPSVPLPVETVQPATQVNPTPATENMYTTERQWRFGLGLSYGAGSRLSFNDIKSATSTGTADLDYENKLAIDLETRWMMSNAWGFQGGLTYDLEREFTGGKVTSNGITTTLSGSDSKIQMTVIYGNAVYSWEQFYLPFGLNISIPKVTPTSGFTGNFSSSGGLGVQFGAGYNINDNFSVEAMLRGAAVKMTSGATDFGMGFLSNLMLTGKYIF